MVKMDTKFANIGAIIFCLVLTACGGGSSTGEEQLDVEESSLANTAAINTPEQQSVLEPQPVSETQTETAPEPESSDIAGDWVNSFYDHQNAESNSSVINRPIQYQNIFDRERALYGYDPRYLPSRPFFDENNLPWMYVQNNNQISGDSGEYFHVSPLTDQPTGKQLTDVTYDNRQFLNRYDESNPCIRCDDYILRLNEEGNWVQLSLYELGNQLGFDAPPQGGDSQGRWRAREDIYFQSNGDVFIALHHGIAHYRKSSNTWHGITRRGVGRNHTMVGDGESPPFFVTSLWPDFDEIVVVKLISDGNGLYRADSFEVNHDYNISYDYPSKWVVKHGMYLHMGGISDNADDFGREDHNTANLYLRLHLETKELDVVFMGWTGNGGFAPPDNHNRPIVLIDEDGYLQYVSGAHGHRIWHASSLLPVDDSQWSNNNSQWNSSTVASDKFTKTPAVPTIRFVNDSPKEPGVNYVSERVGGHTYPEAIVDSDSNIHLFLRNSRFENSDENRYRYLAYYFGESQGGGIISWDDRGDIIAPNWSSYSNYKHLVTNDRSDNIYILYSYEIQNFIDNEWFNSATGDRNLSSVSECAALSSEADCLNVKNEHYNRWPDEPLIDLGSFGLAQQFPHGPVLLGGFNKGTQWGFATTDEFLRRKR